MIDDTFQNHDYATTAEEMAGAVGAFGLPFMRSITSHEALIDKIRAGFGFDHQLALRLPVAQYLDGNTKLAEEEVERTVDDLGPRDDPAAMEFRDFAAAFRALLASKP